MLFITHLCHKHQSFSLCQHEQNMHKSALVRSGIEISEIGRFLKIFFNIHNVNIWNGNFLYSVHFLSP